MKKKRGAEKPFRFFFIKVVSKPILFCTILNSESTSP